MISIFAFSNSGYCGILPLEGVRKEILNKIIVRIKKFGSFILNPSKNFDNIKIVERNMHKLDILQG